MWDSRTTADSFPSRLLSPQLSEKLNWELSAFSHQPFGPELTAEGAVS
jgi:hypothetical protein